MSCAAVIVAAGRSARFGDPVSKVLHDLGGKSILSRVLEAFEGAWPVDSAVVVARAEDRERVEAMFAGRARVVEGGARRVDSVLRGVRAAEGSELVAIHDAARPLVRPETIVATIEAARRSGGAIPAVAAVDTVKRSADGRGVDATVPREQVYLAQTPQVFRREPFLRALEEAAERSEESTDDAQVAERAGMKVELVAGDPDNFKITRRDDLARAEDLLARRSGALSPRAFRIGTGFDVHRLVAGRRCVLGGVAIESDVGPLAHSDGDALLHAVADAVLGAAGLDDLGTLRPDSDPAGAGADSREILRECVALARGAGYSVVNADCVLVCERPRIAPHRAAIRTSLALVLGVDVTSVNVKGKSAEGLGAIGAGEAVVAHATVLLGPVAAP